MSDLSPAFPGWPFFGQDERDVVASVLESSRVNYWTGEWGRRFEQVIAEACQAKHAIAMANGSVTLDAILSVLGIGEGDEVIVTPRSFVASASCIALAGATPVFADVDAVSQNITVSTIEPLINARTRAIIAVHLAGWPCDMDALKILSDDKGLLLIEDAAQAHGAEFNGKPVGGLGHVASFSFCQDKIITTGGEGGAIVTNDDDLWERLWSFKDHGKNYQKCKSQNHPPGYRWLHDTIGTNHRMTEMQAAIGCLQYQKLPAWTEKRRRNAAMLDKHFRDLPALRLAEPPDNVKHAYYKYYVFVCPEQLKAGWDRDRIMTTLNARGVPCMTGVCPEIYLEGAFANQRFGLSLANRLPNASKLAAESLMFQVHPTLETSHIDHIAEVFSSIMIEAAR